MDVVPCVKRAILLLATILAFVGPGGMASAAVPQGVWMVDGKAALQIYDCNGLMCGRLRWLDEPRDVRGEPKHDKNNPDPALRQRALCGLTLFGICVPPVAIVGKAAISTIRKAARPTMS
jgi:hypothetical protein